MYKFIQILLDTHDDDVVMYKFIQIFLDRCDDDV